MWRISYDKWQHIHINFCWMDCIFSSIRVFNNSPFQFSNNERRRGRGRDQGKREEKIHFPTCCIRVGGWHRIMYGNQIHQNWIWIDMTLSLVNCFVTRISIKRLIGIKINKWILKCSTDTHKKKMTINSYHEWIRRIHRSGNSDKTGWLLNNSHRKKKIIFVHPLDYDDASFEMFFACLILFDGRWSLVAGIIVPRSIKSFVLCGS